MKINEKTFEKAKSIPIEKRVFIYNADIILEFLDKSFVPLPYFLRQGEDGRFGLKAVELGSDLTPEHFKEGLYEKYTMTIDKLYEMYQVYREGTDYTMQIEPKAKFRLIIDRMRFNHNGWQFIKRRLTREQIVAFTPLMFRADLPAEDAKQFPKAGINLAKSEVEIINNEENDT